MRFAPHTDDDVREMLAACGLDSVDQLFEHIPSDVRLDRPLDIPAGVSEMEILSDMRTLAARNRHADDLVSYSAATGRISRSANSWAHFCVVRWSSVSWKSTPVLLVDRVPGSAFERRGAL